MEADLAIFVDREGPVLSYKDMILEGYVIEELVAQECARTEGGPKRIAFIS